MVKKTDEGEVVTRFWYIFKTLDPKEPCYYVEMPHSPIVTLMTRPETIPTLVVNLEKPLVEEEKED